MPHDFRNKSFQKVLRGYAPDEVDEYIAYLNEEYRKLERRTADSERKLALALKKLDESVKNGSVDSVGPAARDAAAKLLRETEAERGRILTEAKELAEASTEEILKNAGVQAEAIVAEAMQRAEAILAEAEAEAEAHRDDVKNAQSAAQSIYEEIGSFRDRLYALYNEHLDALEGVTDAAEEFKDGVDRRAEGMTETVPEEAEESEDTEDAETAGEAEECAEPEELPEEEDLFDEPDAAAEEDESGADEEYPEADEEDTAETEEDGVFGDEVANNLAFMDRLFASLQPEESVSGDDLYIDIPEEEDCDPEDEPEEGAEFDRPEEEPEEAESEFPAIMIDWKNRSAVSAPDTDTEEEPAEELPEVDESTDFRPSSGFEELEAEIDDFGEEAAEENYDDYRPEELPVEEAEDDGEFGEFEEGEEEETDEFHDMDQIFNEDKSKREMSLTDEFNIIFDDSKSSQNVKEISRQPIVAPENPKNAKKHKKN